MQSLSLLRESHKDRAHLKKIKTESGGSEANSKASLIVEERQIHPYIFFILFLCVCVILHPCQQI